MLRRTLHVAWALAVVGVLAWHVAAPLPGQESSWPWATGLMAFPVAAALILIRRPRNPIGRVLGLVGLCAATIFVGTWAFVEYAHAPWSPYLEALTTPVVVAQFWGVIALLYLFPTGLQPFRSGRWGFGALTAWMLLMAVIGVIRPIPLDVTGRPNPLGIGSPVTTALFDVGLWGLPVGVLLGVATLAVRWRRAQAVERTQLKWFISASLLVIAMVAMIAFVPEESDSSSALAQVLGGIIVVGGFWALPAAIVTAVLRYRLYDIDRLVSRTVTYAALTGILAAVYLAGVLTVTRLLAPLGAGSEPAVAAATLATAAVFTPARRRIQALVDRRFNRARYDAEQVLTAFRRELRDELDLGQIGAALTAAAERALQPQGLVLWLSNPVVGDRHPSSPRDRAPTTEASTRRTEAVETHGG